uniref:Uncharacterized protein n=1 Tax=Arundo donax TaxID=35708 RepID=A0A0A9GUW4_ARUDO
MKNVIQNHECQYAKTDPLSHLLCLSLTYLILLFLSAL